MNIFQRAKILLKTAFATAKTKFVGKMAPTMEEIELPQQLHDKSTPGAFGRPRHTINNPAGSKLAKRFAKHATAPRGY